MTVLNTCFFRVSGLSAKMEVHRPTGFRNIFAEIAASYVHYCIPAVQSSICSHIPLLCADVTRAVTKIISLPLYQLLLLVPLSFLSPYGVFFYATGRRVKKIKIIIFLLF